MYECVIQASFLPIGAKDGHEVNSHHTTRVSPTAAPPKYLIEHAIGRYWSSDIGQAEYGCMNVSFKSPFFRLGPMRSKVIIQLGFLPLRHHQST